MMRGHWHARIGTAGLCIVLSDFSLASAAAAGSDSTAPVWSVDELRPTLSTPDGRFNLSLRARLQVDVGGFDQAADVEDITPERDVEFKHLNSGALVRRAYLGIEGRAFRDLWYEFRLDFGSDGSYFADPYVNLARISYIAGDPDAGRLFRVNVGLIKPIFTFEDATSSASLTFLERAAVVNVATDAFGGGGSRLGAEVTLQRTNLLRAGDNVTISAAFTGHAQDTDVASGESEGGTYLLGRAAYRLWSDGTSNVQLGASASRILSLDDGAGPLGFRSVRLEDQPEIRFHEDSLVGTGPIPAKGGALWGVETGANFRNFYFGAEFYKFRIERDTQCLGCVAAADPEFSGWHLDGSWILTGETKTYQANAMNNGMAAFVNPRVAAPFALDGRSWGAWEIAARYSELDLNWQAGPALTTCTGAFAGCVRGGHQQVWTVGLNWYLNNNFRMLLDYMMVEVDKLDSVGKQAGQTFSVVGARFQFTN